MLMLTEDEAIDDVDGDTGNTAAKPWAIGHVVHHGFDVDERFEWLSSAEL